MLARPSLQPENWGQILAMYSFGVFPLWLGAVIVHACIYHRRGWKVVLPRKHSRLFLFVNLLFVTPPLIGLELYILKIFGHEPRGEWAFTWGTILAILLLLSPILLVWVGLVKVVKGSMKEILGLSSDGEEEGQDAEFHSGPDSGGDDERQES